MQAARQRFFLTDVEKVVDKVLTRNLAATIEIVDASADLKVEGPDPIGVRPFQRCSLFSAGHRTVHGKGHGSAVASSDQIGSVTTRLPLAQPRHSARGSVIGKLDPAGDLAEERVVGADAHVPRPA